MQIKVLQHHIDEGIQSDPYSCPIANAIKEQYPKIERVVVHGWIILDGYWWETPKEAMKFISEFDGHRSISPHKVKPFEFELHGEGNKSEELKLVVGKAMYDSASG